MDAPKIYKVCTIGRSHVGKTSLIIRLIKGEFNDSVEATVGVSFLTKTYLNNVSLHFWDTAGQERFDSMLPSYLRCADVILLCSDADNLADLENDIVTYLKKIPDPSVCVVICSTKFDRGISENNSEDYLLSLERYEHFVSWCNNKGYQHVTTSAKSGWGMMNLETTIIDICSHIKPAKEPISKQLDSNKFQLSSLTTEDARSHDCAC